MLNPQNMDMLNSPHAESLIAGRRNITDVCLDDRHQHGGSNSLKKPQDNEGIDLLEKNKSQGDNRVGQKSRETISGLRPFVSESRPK